MFKCTCCYIRIFYHIFIAKYIINDAQCMYSSGKDVLHKKCQWVDGFLVNTINFLSAVWLSMYQIWSFFLLCKYVCSYLHIDPWPFFSPAKIQITKLFSLTTFFRRGVPFTFLLHDEFGMKINCAVHVSCRNHL